MKVMINIFLILITALLLAGCNKTSTPPESVSTSTFPLAAGNDWQYEMTQYDIPFNDSALADTESYAIHRCVIGPDTTIEFPDLIIVDDSTSRLDSVIANPFVTRHWYKISGNRLKEYGSIVYYPWETPELQLFESPHILLDFPLTTGKEWITYSWDFGIARSSVVGIEPVETEFGDFLCDVVLTHSIDIFEDDTLQSTFEWYSDEGLIKKEIDCGVVELLDEYGNVLDSARSLEIWELTNLEIQNDR